MKRTLLLICTLFCAKVLFAQTFWIDSLQYEVTSTNPRGVEVDFSLPGITHANIPATVTNSRTIYLVISIGNSAFRNCDDLTSVTIPNSITSIGNSAFNGCSFLQNVPCGTLEAYSSPTSYWNVFFMGRIEEDCEDSGLGDVEETLLSLMQVR